MKNIIKTQAWNGSQIPPADGSDRKLVNEANGKEFLVKPDGSVWLLEDNEQHLIDENEINIHPGFKDSLFSKSLLSFGIWHLESSTQSTPPWSISNLAKLHNQLVKKRRNNKRKTEVRKSNYQMEKSSIVERNKQVEYKIINKKG